jgi:hypothetical protein
VFVMDLQIICMIVLTAEYLFSVVIGCPVGSVNSEGCKTDWLHSGYVFSESDCSCVSFTIYEHGMEYQSAIDYHNYWYKTFERR